MDPVLNHLKNEPSSSHEQRNFNDSMANKIAQWSVREVNEYGIINVN